MDKDKEIKISYRILKIHTTSFSIKDISEQELEDLFKDGNALLNMGSNINIDNSKSIVTIDIKTSLTRKGENKQLVDHTGRTAFFVENIKKFYDPKNDTYDLPTNFILQLLGISFSHSRALLSTELQSSVYADKFVLPVINPNILLPKHIQEQKK